MAETLRDLVVSLSLDSDNFSRNLGSINKQIQQAESRFKAAGAGVTGFEKSAAGLGANLSTLRVKLQLQEKAVEQYRRALDAANTKLTAAVRKNDELKSSLDGAKAKYSDLKNRIDQTRAACQASVKATGDNSEESNRLGLELLDLEEQYKATGAEIKKLEGQLGASRKSMQNAADAVTKAETNLNSAKAALKETEAAIQNTAQRLEKARSKWFASGAAMESFGKKATVAGQALERAGQKLTTFASVPLAGLGVAAAKASIDFEEAFAGVRKTVDATEGEYKRLASDVKAMSTQVTADTTAIAAVMENAGQLGIRNSALTPFTRTMIDLGNATNLASEEAATALAQFANVTGMAQDNFGRLGSVIVELGNNMATTERDIVNMATRLASAGTQVGLSESQILGFAAALASVGIEAEAGGSAFSKIMVEMQLAAETGKNGLSDFAKVAGMTASEFREAWKTDAASAIQAFIVGLSRMDESGISAIATLQGMGITEVRLRDTLLRATNANELFGKALIMANDEWKRNTALTKEASTRYATTQSRITILGNKVKLFGQAIGDDLSPTIGKMISGADDLLDSLMELDEGQRQALITAAAWVAGIGPGILVLGKLNTAVGTISTGFGKLITTAVSAGGGMKGVLAACGSLLGPVGIAAVAAAALYGAYRWIDYASGAREAREALQGMAETAKAWSEQQATTVFDTGNDALSRFGLTPDSFGGIEESKDWLSRLNTTWTDGKKETSEIVKSYVDEFKADSDQLRQAVEERQKILSGLGVKDTRSDEALKQLDAYDKEVQALLKKRRNGELTDKDQARLEEIVTQRVQIKLEYALGESGGYEKILQGVEAEKARLEAEGGAASIDLYADAMKAAAQGSAEYNAALEETYAAEYRVIAAMQDGADKQKALDALNERHIQAKIDGAKKYAEALSQLVGPMLQSDELGGADEKLQKLVGLLSEFQIASAQGGNTSGILTQLDELTKGMDEGELASYLAILTQIQDAVQAGGAGPSGGFTPKETQKLFPNLNIKDVLGGYASIADFLKANAGSFEGLSAMFNEALPDEVKRVLVDLDLTSASAAWEQFKTDTSSLTTMLSATVTGTVHLTPIDAQAAADFRAANPVSLDGQVMKVGMVGGAAQAFKDKFDAGLLALYDEHGVPIPVTPEAAAQIKAADLVLGTDENGVLHVQVLPKIGSPEGVQNAEAGLNSVPQNFLPDWLKSSTADKVTSITSLVQGVEDLAAAGETLSAQQGKSVVLEQLHSLNPKELENISTCIAQAMAALESGALDAETEAKVREQLNALLTVVQTADEYLGVGNDISAGIASGLTAYDWTGDAATVASSIETALRAAAQTHSPSAMTRPIGADLSAGVAVGMMGYGFGSAAGVVAASAKSSLSTELAADTMKPIGKNAMVGMAAGILSGQNLVVNAMRIVAEAAVRAAKAKLKIQSPSKVFRDEVGRMMVRGIGEGTILESKVQARIIRNAARYLTGAAQAGAGSTSSYDNRRTYHQDQSVTVQVDKLYVRDEKDVRSLAIELAQFNKTQYAGMGVK
ncbi:phage tail tape measure protein [Bacillota bacterium Meth-B3]